MDWLVPSFKQLIVLLLFHADGEPDYTKRRDPTTVTSTHVPCTPTLVPSPTTTTPCTGSTTRTGESRAGVEGVVTPRRYDCKWSGWRFVRHKSVEVWLMFPRNLPSNENRKKLIRWLSETVTFFEVGWGFIEHELYVEDSLSILG